MDKKIQGFCNNCHVSKTIYEIIRNHILLVIMSQSSHFIVHVYRSQSKEIPNQTNWQQKTGFMPEALCLDYINNTTTWLSYPGIIKYHTICIIIKKCVEVFNVNPIWHSIHLVQYVSRLHIINGTSFHCLQKLIQKIESNSNRVDPQIRIYKSIFVEYESLHSSCESYLIKWNRQYIYNIEKISAHI